MQEQNMTALMQSVFEKPQQSQRVIKQKMAKLAVKNERDISYRTSPDYMRTPTAAELEEIRQWAIDYKSFHTKASKREVRKATQHHFKIKIFR